MSLEQKIQELDVPYLDKVVDSAIASSYERECKNHDCLSCLLTKKLKGTRLYNELTDGSAEISILFGRVTAAELFFSGFLYALSYYDAKEMEALLLAKEDTSG